MRDGPLPGDLWPNWKGLVNSLLKHSSKSAGGRVVWSSGRVAPDTHGRSAVLILEASNLDTFGFFCGCFLPRVVSCFSATLVTVCSAAFLGGAFPFTTVVVEAAVLD